MEIRKTTKKSVRLLASRNCADMLPGKRDAGGSKMLKLIVYKLTLDADEAQQLRRLLVTWNKACDYAAKVADQKHRYNVIDMRRKVGSGGIGLRDDVASRFSLKTGIADAVVNRVSSDYKRLNGGRRVKKVIPHYGDNTYMDCNKDTASLRLPVLRPWHTAELPWQISLTTKGKRLLVPFAKTDETPKDDSWQEFDMRLQADEDGRWVLRVAVPEKDLDEDAVVSHPEDIATGAPTIDYDHTPPDDDGYGYVSPDEVMD